MSGHDILDCASAHFRSQFPTEDNDVDLPFVEVPEWSESEDEPLKIYFKPMNLQQQDTIYQFVNQGSLKSLAQTLITRALDSNGKRLFANSHMVKFMKSVDPKVVERIIEEMANIEPDDDDEALEKN